MKLFLLTLLGLLTSVSFAQTKLSGKIISEGNSLEGIHIWDISHNSSTLSDKDGFFTLLAKSNDTLLFTGMQIEGMKMVLHSDDFLKKVFTVKIKVKTNELGEVMVKNYPEIDAVKMGIVSEDVKSYTPAERKLQTAGDFKLWHLVGLLGGNLPLDPIINKISGRTAMLKKELEVERKETLLQRLNAWYAEDFFVDQLQISPEYVKGFQIYAIDDARLIASMKAKNKTLTTFLLGELAEKYKLVLFPEKK